MSPKQIDGVIEAVRYTPHGNVDLVRVYERRGPTFSDWVTLTRDQLLQKLRTGKKFYVGERIPLQASTFKLGSPVLFSGLAGHEVIMVLSGNKQHDNLPGAPLF
jgi:hypothetical protein